jgi:HK97 family phage portal protein
MGFFSSLFQSKTLEERAAPQRQHPSADIDWAEFLGAASRTAGLPAPSVESAMTMPAVYACVRVLAETVASLPLITYRTRPDGGRERAGDLPLARLLARRPNPEMTAFELEELLTSHCAQWGNGYAFLELDRRGQVTALWPLRPDRTQPVRRNGELQYRYRMDDGQEVVIPAWQVHHRRGLSGDGIVGYSPVRVAMLAVALGMATEEFGARFFSNGARPGMVLEHPGKLSDQAFDRLRVSWRDDHQGLSNAHKIRILEEGMKIETLGIPPEEAQFLQTRTFQAQEIARIFRMPPHKIGLLENSTFSNIEHQAIEFVTDTIRPWLRRFEQAQERDLLTESERQTIYTEYLVEGLLRGDTVSRYQSYAVGRQWGWLAVNDIRRLENMEPIDDGDVYLQPLNMVQAGAPAANGAPDAAGQTRSPGSGAGAAAWLRPVVEDAAKRLARREAADLRSQGMKALRSQPEAFGGWLQEFYGGVGEAGSQMLQPVATAAAQAAGRSEDALRSAVNAAVFESAWRSLQKARTVTSEAQGAGMTPAQALEQYAAMIEAAGPQVLADAVLAALGEAAR